jgi:protein-S-isoprenylcysteine O-methyltransferase Ste14
MVGIAFLIYGSLVYFLFLATSVYAVAFVGDLPVPKTIDTGQAAPPAAAAAIDLLLLLLFAIQHSIMARQFFKRWWTQFVPWPLERSTFVLFASVAFIVLFWQWRPISDNMWLVSNPAGTAIIQGIFRTGWIIVFASTFFIDHFQFLGLRQVYAKLRGQTLPPPKFMTPFLYKWVRHPLYFGFLLAFWAAPIMTAGHVLFAAAATVYILIGIRLEEHDLVRLFGDQYRRYRQRVSMLIPLP